MDKSERLAFLQKQELEAHAFTISETQTVFSHSGNQSLLRRFNALFKKDSNGKPRDWMAIEEKKIQEIYNDAKSKLELVFDQFKSIRYPTGVSQLESIDDDTPGADDTAPNVDQLIQKPREYEAVD